MAKTRPADDPISDEILSKRISKFLNFEDRKYVINIHDPAQSMEMLRHFDQVQILRFPHQWAVVTSGPDADRAANSLSRAIAEAFAVAHKIPIF